MNRVVEASGGILWQRETVAVELIQARTGCTREEAAEALKVWLRDKRVSSKSDPTAEEVLHILRIRPLPEAPKYEVSINMHELHAVLARSRPLRKHAGGRPPTYNWEKAELALAAECKLKEGIPHHGHSDRKWRTLADACRCVHKHFNRKDGGPAESVLKEHVGPMLERIERRMAGN